MPTLNNIIEGFQNIQDSICNGLEQLDGQAKFEQDLWEHKGGGGGRTRLIQDGKVIEKGGVNFSAVKGNVPPFLLDTLKVDIEHSSDLTFDATGVSIVLHPQSPMCPIIHMNIRYFEMSNGIWWFGGGIDLTPHYVTPSLAKNFHVGLKTVCDQHHASYYPEFKKWADEYFFIKHRDETRGIGGIFFDRLMANDEFDKAQRWAFVQDVGNTFVDLYSHQIKATQSLPFGEEQTKWQQLRRGRYVEFNLVWDRGTKFGLQTGGRTESILMSLPKQAMWLYDYQTTPNSPEAKTLELLKKDIDWINL
ncbi:MAG: oxygen-dependent coproporphyrinogen oxidase [Aureispira sp.]|nr:oxygen-dependent coproporphyrinogen oxidase [Aureispira sp.]